MTNQEIAEVRIKTLRGVIEDLRQGQAEIVERIEERLIRLESKWLDAERHEEMILLPSDSDQATMVKGQDDG